MTKFEQLDTMLEQGNGYITTRAVTAQGISKPYFAEYARSRELERVAHGVYQSRDAWPDDMYVLHLRNSNIIFSHQSALALHGMMEREPHHIYVTVKQGYNATHLRKQGVIVHTVSPEIFTLGLTSATTTFGNTVPTYDRERTQRQMCIRDRLWMCKPTKLPSASICCTVTKTCLISSGAAAH